MLEKMSKKFEYKKLTEAEQKSRGILGRLVGPCADFVNPTRNGRKYSEKLWENVFSNPIMQEKIKNRCVFGELGHPADRTETDMEKIAICLAEQPKKGQDGKLYGVFDILNTPNGRILKSLCDYGCKIGISSRGQGDLITDMDGEEAVDPDTYDCECFDAVLLPGVEAARLTYVTESLNTKNRKGLKVALTENLKSANDSDRKIMEDTLKNLNINLTEAAEEEKDEEEKLPEVEFTTEEVKDVATEVAKAVVEPAEDVEAAEEQEEEIEEVVDEKVAEAAEAKVEDNEETSSEEDDDETPEDVKEALTEAEDKEASEEETAEEEPAEEDDEIIEIEDEDTESADEEEFDDRTDEEVFLDFLASNFDEDKVREACDILGIEVVEDENASEEAKEETPTDEESEEDKEESKEENEDEIKESKAFNEGLETIIASLQETLKNKSELENTVKSLQEKLAVSDAKVNEINEECDRYKKAVTRLSVLAKSNKDLKESVSTLENSLREKDELIENQKTRIARLVESKKESVRTSNSLSESVNAKTDEIAKLNENLTTAKTDYESQIKALTEQLATEKANNKTQSTKLSEDLTKAITLKESYKKLANKAVNKYIEVKADMLGLTPIDIKRKLGESYTIEDVDQVCEDLKAYSLNVSRLPFDVNRKVGIKVNESARVKTAATNSANSDDEVDESLIKLANLY